MDNANFNHITNFIKSLYTNKDFIPLHAPIFEGNEKKYLLECIDTTFVSSVGKFVDQFELEMARYTGAKKAVVCLNGTNALFLALKLKGVVENNEVITQPLTFIATANAISYLGAHPVFVDIDKETLGLSPKSLLKFIENNTFFNNETKQLINKTTNRVIKACVPMHTFGHPCKIDEILEICNKYNIALIEDAAESVGSFYKNKHTGTFGDIGVLSFNGNKILTTGGGGMLLFNDENLASKAKHLTTQAKVPHAWEFMHDDVGYNYRMPNINAALGLAQLEKLDEFVLNKRETASKYINFFKDSEVKFINEPVNSRSNYWLNCILFKDKEERDLFLKYSNENGVMTRPAWQLMNKLSMFKHCQTDELNNANYIADRLVNIPSSVIK